MCIVSRDFNGKGMSVIARSDLAGIGVTNLVAFFDFGVLLSMVP